ncbi:hypothetical protein EXIGLDRAFT_767659 [Exidia glandulosa HHB12029]|uniref:Uncharacterized protein n=1 Tax=Exidia glandulosa HHB12029 TaxID=1314781 RepID=A0A165IUV7_EXIGL|nr:hypothetical protein EXIGLDRAFT_767659 [Exidia glandulosa HHB12029]
MTTARLCADDGGGWTRLCASCLRSSSYPRTARIVVTAICVVREPDANPAVVHKREDDDGWTTGTMTVERRAERHAPRRGPFAGSVTHWQVGGKLAEGVVAAADAGWVGRSAGRSRFPRPRISVLFNPFAFRPPPKTNVAQVKKPINPTAGSKNLATSSKTPTKTNNAAAAKPKKVKKPVTAMWIQPGGVPGRKAAAANAFRKKKGGKGKGGKGNAGAGAGAGNAGAANATTTTSAAAETTTAADNVAAADTGIKDVVEMCLNADGKTGCFEILGDSKDSCFTIPRPIGNNVAFFLPPPDDTCELFTCVLSSWSVL